MSEFLVRSKTRVCIGLRTKGTITDLPIKYAFSLSLTRDIRQIEPMVKRTSWEYRCPSSSASSDTNDQPGELVQHQSSTAYHVCRQQRCFYTHNVYLTDMHFHMKAIVHQSGSRDDRSRSENGTRPTQQHLRRQTAYKTYLRKYSDISARIFLTISTPSTVLILLGEQICSNDRLCEMRTKGGQNSPQNLGTFLPELILL